MKRLLLLGAGFYHRRVYQALRKEPYYIIGADRDEQAPAAPLADAFHPVDISDEKAVVRLARRVKAHAVMPLNEFGMRAHAAAVEELGLTGNSAASAACAVDKELMRARWASARLAQPRFQAIWADEKEDVAMAAAEDVGFPCVIKPADSGGSGRGVMILRDPGDVAEGMAFAAPFARNRRLLLESFIEGVEVTVEGLVAKGKHVILAVSDKEKPPLRTRVATSLNYPAKFGDEVMARIHDLVHRAVEALGLVDSATHTECIVTPDGIPFLVEMGARGGGGHIFSDIVELVSGVNMPCALAKILCGEALDLGDIAHHGACYRFLIPPSGVLRAVDGFAEAAAFDGVVDIGLLKQPGDRINDLCNSLERAGFVVTRGRSRDEARERAIRVERRIRFLVDDEPQNGRTAKQ